MLDFIVTFVLLAGVIIFVIPETRKIINNASEESNLQFKKKAEYRKRSSVMNSSEEAFFFELKKQLPEGYYIFPKMRIADMIDAIHGSGFYFRRNKILPKHIDFLICDSHFKPIVAIEVNGGYHNSSSQKDKDLIKKEIIENAGLAFEIVNVGSDFSQSIERIKTNLYV